MKKVEYNRRLGLQVMNLLLEIVNKLNFVCPLLSDPITYDSMLHSSRILIYTSYKLSILSDVTCLQSYFTTTCAFLNYILIDSLYE